jgi:hypothetical protein
MKTFTSSVALIASRFTDFALNLLFDLCRLEFSWLNYSLFLGNELKLHQFLFDKTMQIQYYQSFRDINSTDFIQNRLVSLHLVKMSI